MGALFSAAGTQSTAVRIGIRSAALGLCATRILILAHWASDVVAGFVMGVALDRILRLVTGCPTQLSRWPVRDKKPEGRS
jgi:undecaprenyl-diphosphatase